MANGMANLSAVFSACGNGSNMAVTQTGGNQSRLYLLNPVLKMQFARN
ncbi:MULTISPECIES: hypothetical protein [Nostocales]|uniref:Uncharacterized protein n=3 Tax=Nostocales TaxID=1161 RepID=A0A8S9T8M3_9CYAN|nr:hypothetical protein [Tolypothrix bouteillei]KAF3887839.1 hypothetical protein DA73_0400021850 [Tolypothrix bouteillei VB521301]